ncbi:MAG: hypothetical protein ABI614_13115 [Planctomycetota bacterium]
MSLSSLAIFLLGTFLWFWPQRKRNVLLHKLHEGYRHWPARIGLHHTAWTMFAAGTNRNHFLKLRLHSIASEPDPPESDVGMIEVNTIELDMRVPIVERNPSTSELPRTVEFRDPWKRGGVWGELVDERLRRVVLAVIRSDTGPHTKRQLARGLVRWCLTRRVRLPFDEFEGTAIYGQEVFSVPADDITQTPEPRELVKYTLKFKRGQDGRLVFES